MGGPAPAAPGTTDTQPIRMLADLNGTGEDDPSGMTRRTTTAFLALGLAVAGVLVWWMNRPTAAEAERVAAAEVAAPAPRPVTDSAAPAPAVASAPEPAVAAVTETPAASAAGIETAPQAPAAAPAAALAAAPAASAVRAAKAAPRSAPATKPRAVAAHDPDPLGTFIAQRPKATAQTTALAAPAAAVRREKAAHDADVDLIAALLARVSNETAAAGPMAQNDQLTIAQIIRRCEARPEAEVLACKRRICDGYWGKADACPKRLAPVNKAVAG